MLKRNSISQKEIESISHLFLRCSAIIAGKQFLIQKGLKSTALTDLHLTALSKFASSTAIDLILLKRAGTGFCGIE